MNLCKAPHQTGCYASVRTRTETLCISKKPCKNRVGKDEEKQAFSPTKKKPNFENLPNPHLPKREKEDN